MRARETGMEQKWINHQGQLWPAGTFLGTLPTLCEKALCSNGSSLEDQMESNPSANSFVLCVALGGDNAPGSVSSYVIQVEIRLSSLQSGWRGRDHVSSATGAALACEENLVIAEGRRGSGHLLPPRGFHP